MKALLKDRFVLISRWQLDCGIKPAWRLISRVREWPSWWSQVRRVRVADDAADDALQDTRMDDPRVGSSAAIEWKTPLGYGLRLRVTTTRVAAPFELEGIASGDLEGHGLWLLEPRHADGVLITYRWDVHLNRHWMRLTSPLLRPLFAHNHAAVMRAGASAMAQAIGCRLLRYEDISVSPGTPAEVQRAAHQPAPSA